MKSYSNKYHMMLNTEYGGGDIISGESLDISSKLPYVSVILYDFNNSKSVRSVQTDKNGIFNIYGIDMSKNYYIVARSIEGDQIITGRIIKNGDQ